MTTQKVILQISSSIYTVHVRKYFNKFETFLSEGKPLLAPIQLDRFTL